MNFITLPHWATPVPGESRASWLAATGRLQPMESREWEDWIRAAPDEPERPQAGSCWVNLPDVLGDGASIAPTWRLHPSQRKVYCPLCYADDEPQRRWVVRAEWLDARRLTCRVHALPLSPSIPTLGEGAGWRNSWLNLRYGAWPIGCTAGAGGTGGCLTGRASPCGVVISCGWSCATGVLSSTTLRQPRERGSCTCGAGSIRRDRRRSDQASRLE